MTTRQPSNVTDAPAAAQAATPGAGEVARYAPAADLPDAAAIARMANAFYASPASAPVPGPGAALPSAPVFAAEPIYRFAARRAGARSRRCRRTSIPACRPCRSRPRARRSRRRRCSPSSRCWVMHSPRRRRARYSRKAASPAALHLWCRRFRRHRHRCRWAARPPRRPRRVVFRATPTSPRFPTRWAA